MSMLPPHELNAPASLTHCFPHTKAFIKHYGGLVCSGLFVTVLLGQLTLAGIDFLYGEPKKNGDRRNGRR